MTAAVPRSLRLATLLLLVAAGAFATLSPVSTQSRRSRNQTVLVDGREAVAGEALVRYRDPQSGTARERAEFEADADEVEMIGRRGLRRMHSRRHGTSSLLAMLRANPDVEYAEPNYVIRIGAVPNDPSFGNLWGLLNSGQVVSGVTGTPAADISATLAWNTTTGSRANVIAVIDTGVDYLHPDLIGNIWSAPAPFSVTVGGLVINCAAGTHGFNAINNTCNPMDDHDHGTHVSGTIGAVGNNNIGITGVNWIASIMGIKFLDASGSGTTANAIKSVDFAVQTKAAFSGTAGANIRVLSNSWGGGGYSQFLLDAINRANGSDMLFVAAAGNNSSDNDTWPSYPASYAAPNIIAVAATNNRDQLASFSNYGRTSVHLGAPGVGILSTIRHGDATCSTCHLASYNGTSMATPHVSGAAALVLAACTTLNTAQLKSALLTSVDPVAALSSVTSTGGRLNVNQALQSCASVITANLVTPSSGSGSSQTFTAQFGDTAGAADISVANFWFNTSTTTTANSCLAYYGRSGNTVNLLNDAGTAWMSGTRGSAGTLQNSSCAISLAGTTATTSGDTLTVSLPVTFRTAFAGPKNIYLYAGNATGARSGWQTRGSWTVTDGRVTPSVTWNAPASITYPAPLSGTQLNATAPVAGTFTYSPAAGTVLRAGAAQTLSVTFTPSDQATYRNTTATVPLTVARATPVVNWAAPASIEASTPLSATQLNASATVPGTFAYTPAAGTTLSAGAGQTLSVVFTPTDITNYAPVTKTVAITVVPAVLVTADTVSPDSGTGGSQTFVLRYSSTLGAADLSVANVWFNTGISVTANSCLAYYGRVGNTVNLLDDTGTTWMSAPIGSAGTLQNSSCSIATGGATAVDSGNTLTLSLPVVFKAPFIGTRNIYMYAANARGVRSGWQHRGTWTVADARITPTLTWNTPAGITSRTPLGGAQLNATANVAGTFTYTPAAGTMLAVGSQALSVVFTPGNTTAYRTASATVNITVTRATPVVSWPTPANMASGTALTASQLNATASVPGTFVYVPPAGTVMSTGAGQTLSVTFTPTDSANYTTAIASVPLTVVPMVAVTADSMTPSSGTGTSQVFTAQFTDTAGASDLAVANVWFNTGMSSANSCLVYYGRAGNTLNLLDDAGASWTSGVIGTAGTLQNGSCSIALGSAGVSESGTTLTLTLPITFTTAFGGAKNVYLYGSNAAGIRSGWQARGTWTIASAAPPPPPPPPPSVTITADSVTPSSGFGATQAFSLKFTDTGGASDLAVANVWFATTTDSGANSCLAYYRRSDGTMNLLDDTGTSWSSGAMGSGGTIENSACVIALASASVLDSGTLTTLNLTVTFKPAYGGLKTVHLYGGNATGTRSGWQLRGSWIAP